MMKLGTRVRVKGVMYPMRGYENETFVIIGKGCDKHEQWYHLESEIDHMKFYIRRDGVEKVI